jgi:hypothetical protein
MGEAKQRKLAGQYPSSSSPDSGEREFWRRVAQDFSDGWQVHIPSDSPDSGAHVTSADVFIYAVDVSDMWMAFGGFRESDIRRLVSHLMTAPVQTRREVVNGAGTAVAEASDDSARVVSETTKTALLASFMAITQTKTFEHVRAGGSLTGHWVYLLYRCHDGHLMSRPVFAQKISGEEGPLARDAFFGTVLEAVRFDLGPGTHTGASLKAHGGLMLAEKLRAAL